MVLRSDLGLPINSFQLRFLWQSFHLLYPIKLCTKVSYAFSTIQRLVLNLKKYPQILADF